LGEFLQRKREESILILYYLKNMSWREVSRKIGYSRSHILRYRNAGCAELEEKLQGDGSVVFRNQ